MSDIIGPVYIAFALLFAGLFLASFLRPYSPNPANALPLRLPSVGNLSGRHGLFVHCVCACFGDQRTLVGHDLHAGQLCRLVLVGAVLESKNSPHFGDLDFHRHFVSQRLQRGLARF